MVKFRKSLISSLLIYQIFLCFFLFESINFVVFEVVNGGLLGNSVKFGVPCTCRATMSKLVIKKDQHGRASAWFGNWTVSYGDKKTSI